MELLIKQMKKENQRYFKIPIRNKKLSDMLPREGYESLEQLIHRYLFAVNKDAQISAEQEIRTLFRGARMQFAVIQHSPQCRKDIFMTRLHGDYFIYVGSIEMD